MPASPKTAVLLLNMGGPDSLESVRPFLYNLFSDPDIIRLPLSWLFQKPLAWTISTRRGEEARKNYAMMGGASPILPWTRRQADALKSLLEEQNAGEWPVYIAMRYWHPFTEATVDAIIKDGVTRLIVLPLYPHFSYTTTGSSLNALKRELERRRFQPELTIVPPYYNHPLYLDAMRECVAEGLDSNTWGCPKESVRVLFSAHSLPLKHIKRMKDPYPEQIEECARLIMEAFPENPWDLCFQSQVGKIPWLGPSVEGVLHYFAGENRDNILIVALSFVSDHVETLVEIDKLYLPLAKALEIEYCHRAPTLNDRPAFIKAMAALVSPS